MYQLPYGKKTLRFSLLPEMRGYVAVSNPVRPLADAPAAIADALQQPLGTRPLREITNAGSRVCIVFTDATRACPDHLLVPALLSELTAGGVRDENITLLCGIGMHRPSTSAEKVAKLGSDVVSRYRVIDSEPQNPSALVDLGKTANGVPVSIHRSAVEADMLIATGIVEPHQYAGYSGGFKTLAVGAAGEDLITYTHGPAFLDREGTRLGRIDGNPFQEAVTEAARRAGLQFILNVVLDDDKHILRVAAGQPDAAFRELVAFARSVYEVAIPRQFDIAIGGAGFPKDSNLYQASRAASYMFFAPTCIVRPGGYFIIPAPCAEGAGSGIGEQRFLSAMRDAPDIRSILEDARRNGYPAGQQRAFVMAKVLEKSRVVIVGSECPDIVAACKMIPAADMNEALRIAGGDLGRSCDVLIVPHALLTLPVVLGKAPPCAHRASDDARKP
jgi:nickel-dependent lactate racemase